MTITDDRPAAAPVPRASSGVAIIGSRLLWWRMIGRGMSRQQLCDKLADLYRDGHPDALPFTHYGPADHPVVLSADGKTCTACGAMVSGGLTRDAIAKFEKYPGPGSRKPKPRTALALAAALSTPDEPVTVRELRGENSPGMPDGKTFELPEITEIQARAQNRIDRNAAMRAFADALGRPDLYTNPSGRIFYYKELRDLYARFEAAAGLAG